MSKKSDEEIEFENRVMNILNLIDLGIIDAKEDPIVLLDDDDEDSSALNCAQIACIIIVLAMLIGVVALGFMFILG